MIRLIQKRLIIPRGDTGSFSLPLLTTINDNDIAVFGILDPLTQKTVLEKQIVLSGDAEYITINFAHDDTKNLSAKKYLWDIKIYTSPIYDEDDILIDAAEITSYYAAYSLPICEIREVTHNA